MSELQQNLRNSSISDSLPPLLTGGVTLPEKGCLKSVGCDYLTVSMPSSEARKLTDMLPLSSEQPLLHFKGFKHHEWRDSLGGTCQRHSGPHTESRAHGNQYELWCWTGELAVSAASVLVGAGIDVDLVKCTRADMAFDFHCGPDLDPEHLLSAWSSVWRDEKRLEAGVAGHGDPLSYTRYIGGMTSDRRIRLYRKDLERGQGSPLLRVELVLKGEWAHSLLWEMLCVNAGSCNQFRRDVAAVGLAAGHVLEMTGLQAVSDWDNVPMRKAKPRVEIASTIAAMITQYGKVLSLCKDLEIDFTPMIEARQKQISRRTRFRWKAALEKASEAGGEEIASQALDLVLNGFGTQNEGVTI